MKSNLETLSEELERAHRDYRRAVEDVEDEVNRYRRELTQPAREELSQKMHAAHRQGLSKDRIRRAVKAYNNASAFDPLWNAFQPEVDVDLRRSTKTEPAQPFTWAGDTLTLTLSDGSTRVLTNVALSDGEYVDWNESGEMIGDENLSEIMRLAFQAAQARDIERSEKED